MEIHKFEIPYKKCGEKFEVFPIGCIHAGQPNFNKPFFEKLMKWVESNDHAYIIGMGDMMDATHPGHPFFNIEQVDRDMLTIEDQYYYIQKTFTKLAEMGRIIGLHEGNHDNRLVPNSGFNWVGMLCKDLNVKFLGHTALTRLGFERNNHKTSWDIFSTHGYFRGTTPAGKLNKMLSLQAGFGADVYLHGDTHEVLIHEYPFKFLNNAMTLETRNLIFALTGSFLDTYKEGTKSYGEKKNYKPIKIGCPKIIFYPEKRVVKATIYATEEWKDW
jgi:hypothetical protein